MNNIFRTVTRIRETYNSIMSIIAMIFLIGFIGSVLVQVVSRTFLPKTPAWTEEMARYLFIYMVAFGSSVAVRTKEFVGIDMFTNILPKKVRDILGLIISIILLVFSIYTCKNSVAVFLTRTSKIRMVATATQIHMKYFYYSMAIFFGLLAFSFLLEIILSITEEKPRKEAI
ncbi:TRAP transporter small permease [Fusobacterium sp. PH5-44]|uniref:TRAP transporter small permease n=1 Tax=unclassified Fusobacterium TaxID=2648384 RepID=UPI003D20DB83